jgi:hypothetical protein
MMGRENPVQPSLFYTGLNLEKRVRSDHVLRKVARLVDFDFVYGEVRESYGYNGNVSVPPPMILKLMLLLVLYNVRSERELMATLPERLDWLETGETGSDFDFMTILTTEGLILYKSQSWRADPDCLPPGCSITSSSAATNGERLFSVAPITKPISNGLAATEGSSVTPSMPIVSCPTMSIFWSRVPPSL